MDGVAVAGVIHFPFSGKTHWGWVEHGNNILDKNEVSPYKSFIMSRSHTGEDSLGHLFCLTNCPNTQKSFVDLLTPNQCTNVFAAYSDFLEYSRRALLIPHQFLYNFGTSNSEKVRWVFRPARYFTKIKVYEANNRYTIGSGISTTNIDCFREMVKNNWTDSRKWALEQSNSST